MPVDTGCRFNLYHVAPQLHRTNGGPIRMWLQHGDDTGVAAAGPHHVETRPFMTAREARPLDLQQFPGKHEMRGQLRGPLPMRQDDRAPIGRVRNESLHARDEFVGELVRHPPPFGCH